MYNYNNFQKNQKKDALEDAIGENDAPKALSGSTDAIAAQIMHIARENNVPIPPDSNLVEILSILDIGEYLPIEVYSILAKTITCLYEHEEKIIKKDNRP